jgi:hypothetical protein
VVGKGSVRNIGLPLVNAPDEENAKTAAIVQMLLSRNKLFLYHFTNNIRGGFVLGN